MTRCAGKHAGTITYPNPFEPDASKEIVRTLHQVKTKLVELVLRVHLRRPIRLKSAEIPNI